jgi:outer membrane protein assembly factor BamE (lipoprotein component of BamABCDE complex)
MYKQTIVVLIVIAGCATVAAAIAFTGKSRPFSGDSWKAAAKVSKPSNTDNPRSLMADDLLKNHLKSGMTRDEVLSLLGPADQERERSLWYNIGSYQRRGFLSGSDQLVVGFDENDKLKIARVAAD